MKRAQTGQRVLTLADGSRLRLTYWRLAGTGETGEEFGLEIADDRGNRAAIPGITPSQGAVDALLARMAQGGVTTVTAREVVEDYLAR